MAARRSGPRTLGPVADLERHLPADWWRTLFNALYLKTDGDVVENDDNTVRDVDALIATVGLEPDDRILDLCCGQGRHVLELARRGYRAVTGLDRSRTLIRLAKARARKAGLDVRLHEGDARLFRLPSESFDCVAILGNSFGYFEHESQDLEVLAAAARVLRADGHLVLDLADGDWMRRHFEPRSWEWIDQDHLVCRERSLASDGHRLVSREVVVHAERGGDRRSVLRRTALRPPRNRTPPAARRVSRRVDRADGRDTLRPEPGPGHDGPSQLGPSGRTGSVDRPAHGTAGNDPLSRGHGPARRPVTSRRGEAGRAVQRRGLRHGRTDADRAGDAARVPLHLRRSTRRADRALREGSAGLRLQPLRRGIRERRAQGAARPGAARDARRALLGRGARFSGPLLRQGEGRRDRGTPSRSRFPSRRASTRAIVARRCRASSRRS